MRSEDDGSFVVGVWTAIFVLFAFFSGWWLGSSGYQITVNKPVYNPASNPVNQQ